MESDKSVIKPYSFAKQDILDVREMFICMQYDAKEIGNDILDIRIELLINNLEYIINNMIDEDFTEENKRHLMNINNEQKS